MTATVIAAADRVYFPMLSGDYFVYYGGKTRHVVNLTSPDLPVIADCHNDADVSNVVTVLFLTEQDPTPATSTKYMDHELARLIEEEWDIHIGELQKLWTSVQWQPSTLSNPQEELKLPTLIFSPGAGMPCSFSTLMTSDTVSQGYRVICVDYPGEAPYLEIPYTNRTISIYGFAVNYDYADEEVLYNVNDRCKKGVNALLQAYPALADDYGAPFNTSSYLEFGLSMSGSLGSDTVRKHGAVLKGINYDGMLISTILRGTGFRAIRQVSGGTSRCWGHTILTSPTWACGFELLGLNGMGPMKGTIEPFRMRKIISTFTMGFLHIVLREGLNQSLLLVLCATL